MGSYYDDPVDRMLQDSLEERAAINAFSPQERRIIHALYAANKPLTTNKVAEYAEMSRPTAKLYLTKLYKREIVDGGKYKKGIYWWIKNAYVANVVDRVSAEEK